MFYTDAARVGVLDHINKAVRGRVVELPGLYSDELLNEIARANDIVEVVSQYFPLKRAGKEFKALCPFHAEKTPSFNVNPSKQIFKCFGCGRGGSVFNFVMAKENITFPEAVRMLAERAGIDLGDRVQSEKGAGVRRQVRDVLEWAAQRFETGLKHPSAGAPGREYLESRAIAEESIARFRIGYAPEGWDNLLRAAGRDGITVDLLESAGLVIKREDGSGYYDRFRGRVIFPILDTLNRPIGFGGRALGDEQPKYLNSPETSIFHKGEALYGLAQARQAIDAQRRVVVVEGYFDVIMPHQVGVQNVVATLGTALTEEHVRALKRYADEVVLVFDSDLAGQRAADKGLELFLAGDVKINIAVVPSGKDPYDFCRAEGAEPFRRLLAEAQDAFAYKWAAVAKEYDAASSPAAQRRALEAMLGSIAKAPVLAREDLRLQRDLILGHMSRVLGIPEETLRSEFSRLKRTPGRSAAGVEVGAALPEQARLGRRWTDERELLTVLLCRPSRVEAVMKVLPPDRIETAAFRRLYEAIAANPMRQDGDIESIVLRMEEPELASMAVDLFERGERLSEVRDPADTGPGPLEQMLVSALTRITDMQEEKELAALRRTASENTTTDSEALRAFAEARVKRQGFVPPAGRRQELPGT